MPAEGRTEHYEALVKACERLIANVRVADKCITPPHTHYTITAGDLTVLSRVLRDGCTYEEVINA